VAVNAALTVGFGYDYKAAAECQTVLHAVPFDAATLGKLLERAAVASGDNLQLSDAPKIDADLRDQAAKIFSSMSGFLPAPVKDVKSPQQP
jgi:hypothetical protein